MKQITSVCAIRVLEILANSVQTEVGNAPYDAYADDFNEYEVGLKFAKQTSNQVYWNELMTDKGLKVSRRISDA